MKYTAANSFSFFFFCLKKTYFENKLIKKKFF